MVTTLTYLTPETTRTMYRSAGRGDPDGLREVIRIDEGRSDHLDRSSGHGRADPHALLTPSGRPVRGQALQRSPDRVDTRAELRPPAQTRPGSHPDGAAAAERRSRPRSSSGTSGGSLGRGGPDRDVPAGVSVRRVRTSPSAVGTKGPRQPVSELNQRLRADPRRAEPARSRRAPVVYWTGSG